MVANILSLFSSLLCSVTTGALDLCQKSSTHIAQIILILVTKGVIKLSEPSMKQRRKTQNIHSRKKHQHHVYLIGRELHNSNAAVSRQKTKNGSTLPCQSIQPLYQLVPFNLKRGGRSRLQSIRGSIKKSILPIFLYYLTSHSISGMDQHSINSYHQSQ